MPLHKIFNEAPKSFGADDIVGRFRSGMQLGNRPVALSEWRVTSGDPKVMEKISKLYTGDIEEWETTTEENLQVLTNISTVNVELISVDAGLTLWGRGTTPIRSCDGITQRDDASSPCICPSDLKEHKAAAKQGTACIPSIRLLFRLVDDPELGIFKFQSGSWQLAEAINPIEEAVKASDEPLAASISLEQVSWETKTGEKRQFTKPVVEFLKVAA